MLTLLAHTGQPPAPHDAWTAWNLDPLIIGTLALAVWLYHRGATPSPRPADVRRGRAFGVAITVLAVALLSPLDAISAALASAHMVQHVLLILVAAPLLAYSAPTSRVLRGAPATLRRLPGQIRAALHLRPAAVRRAANPVVVWLLYVGTLWFWHSGVAYDATLASAPVHALEHATFLITALLLWRVVIGARGERLPGGAAVLTLFGAAMASVFLSLLLTFARTPWYAGYAETTAAWGLTPLADQQLAGVLMWVPAGALHVVAAIALLVAWLRSGDTDEPALRGSG